MAEKIKNCEELINTLKQGKQERRQYQTLFDQAPEGYLITEFDATIQAANRKALALLFVPRGGLTGDPFEHFVIKEERETFRVQLVRLRSVLNVVDMDVTLETQQGTTCLVSLTIYAMHAREGKWARLGIALRNITDSRSLRQTHPEWGGVYRKLFETINASIVMTSAEDKIATINPTGVRIFGYASQGLYRQDIWQLYANPADRERFWEQIKTLGGLRSDKVKVRGKHGEKLDCLNVSTLWMTHGGSIWGSQSIFRDIAEHKRFRAAPVATREELEGRVAAHTAALRQRNEQLQAEVLERRRAEETLRERNEWLSNLIAGSSQGILLHRDDRPLFVNQAYANIFGYDRPEEILDIDSLWILVAPHERERLAGYHKDHLKGQDVPRHYEYQGIRRDGSPIWIENNVTLINWEGTTALQSIAVDVTRRKQIERDLHQSQEKLWKLAANLQERQEEERKYIAREIHDELGQMLTGLKLEAVWLARQNPQVLTLWQERLAMMIAQIDTLVDTVRRISTGLHPQILDDLGLVAVMEHLLQDTRRRTGMIYRLSVPSEELAIEPGRATALFRIFQEALTNVIRHAHATMVSVRLGQQSGALLLEIYDNGQGISLGDMGRRDAFGLRSMRERAALWNGTVEIQGRPGKGTTVTVCMPSGLSQGKEEDDSYPRG